MARYNLDTFSQPGTGTRPTTTTALPRVAIINTSGVQIRYTVVQGAIHGSSSAAVASGNTTITSNANGNSIRTQLTGSTTGTSIVGGGAFIFLANGESRFVPAGLTVSGTANTVVINSYDLGTLASQVLSFAPASRTVTTTIDSFGCDISGTDPNSHTGSGFAAFGAGNYFIVSAETVHGQSAPDGSLAIVQVA